MIQSIYEVVRRLFVQVLLNWLFLLVYCNCVLLLFLYVNKFKYQFLFGKVFCEVVLIFEMFDGL